jgi:tetratricopeptide (TPR) repeat protein
VGAGLVAVVVCAALFDEVELHNGGRLVGKILAENDQQVTLRLCPEATVTLQRAEIKTLRRKETPEEEVERRRAALRPDDPGGRIALAERAEAADLIDEAVELYREALSLDAANARTRARLGALTAPRAAALLAQAGRIRERAAADAALERLVARYPEAPAAAEARLSLAGRRFEARQFDEAERWYRAALDHQAPDARAVLGWIGVCAARQQWDEAEAVARRYKLDPAEAAKVRRLLELSRRGDESLSLDELTEWGRLCLNFGAAGTGLARLESAYRRDTKNAAVASRLSELYEAAGRPREAMSVARSAGLDAHLELISTRLRYAGEWTVADPDAIKRVERLVALDLAGETSDRAALAGEPRRLIEAAVRCGRRYEAEPDVGKVLKRTLKMRQGPPERPEWEIEYLVRPPRDYDPAIRTPLLVSLHGLKERGEYQMALWRGHVEAREGLFVVCPTAGPYGWGTSTWGHDSVRAVIEDVARRYHIDPDRIWITGSSMGGTGSFEIGCHYPGLAAAISPRVGCFRILTLEDPRSGKKTRSALYVENLKNTPTYWIVGARDPKCPIEFVHLGLQKMRELKYELLYREFAEGGHEWFAQEDEPVLDWFAARARPRYPPEVQLLSDESILRRAWWVEILEHAGAVTGRLPHHDTDGNVCQERPQIQPAARVEARARTDENRFVVTARGVKKLRLYLHDALVDFERPIRVTLNGRTTTFKDVRPSVAFLLDEVRRTGDRTRTYWAQIELAVP